MIIVQNTRFIHIFPGKEATLFIVKICNKMAFQPYTAYNYSLIVYNTISNFNDQIFLNYSSLIHKEIKIFFKLNIGDFIRAKSIKYK